MAFGSGIEIRGLKEFRSALRALDRDLPKQLRAIHKKAADVMAEAANAAAPASARGSIKGRATGARARVEFTPGRRGDALAKIWGAKRHTGWYRRRRYRASTASQFQPFVGTTWEVGSSGGAPYFVGSAMNARVDDLLELYGDELVKLAERAFPD